jgi:hypothetical protein
MCLLGYRWEILTGGDEFLVDRRLHGSHGRRATVGIARVRVRVWRPRLFWHIHWPILVHVCHIDPVVRGLAVAASVVFASWKLLVRVLGLRLGRNRRVSATPAPGHLYEQRAENGGYRKELPELLVRAFMSSSSTKFWFAGLLSPFHFFGAIFLVFCFWLPHKPGRLAVGPGLLAARLLCFCTALSFKVCARA